MEEVKQEEKKEEEPKVESPKKEAVKKIPLSEIQKHNKEGDLWVVLGERVLEVSKFDHPGGVEILLKNSNGVDAQSNFDKKGHSEGAKKLAETLVIGEVE